MMGAVTPETCRVTLLLYNGHMINTCCVFWEKLIAFVCTYYIVVIYYSLQNYCLVQAKGDMLI